VSLVFLRHGSKEGELTFWRRLRTWLGGEVPGGERRRKPRHVWNNPIAWREAATKASAAGRATARWVFVVGGVLAAILLLSAHERGWWGLNPAQPLLTRAWLTVLCWIELAVILVLVTNTAATALTREKESLTLELLLSTPLTSRYIIAGMLRGLVSFVIPMIAVPTFTVLLFVVADLLRSRGPDVTTPEALLLVPLLMTAFVAAAAMVGLQFSLLSRKTVQAVMISTVVVMGASGLLVACALAMVQGGGMVAALVLPFTPFHAVQALVDYQSLFSAATGTPTADDLLVARVTRLVTSVVAVVIYAAATYSLYKNMVRNFDMTVRRQSA